MNLQKIIRNSLLALVAGSLLYLVGREVADSRSANGSALALERESGIGPATKLVVYYFSQGKECTTCEYIPAYTREVLDTHFSKELADGGVVWRSIDVDERKNEHYIDEFRIYTKSIVLVRVADGKQIGWENLAAIWDLVYDKAAFTEYVRKEIRKALDGTP